MIARLRPEVRYSDIFLSLFSDKKYSEKLEKGLLDFFKIKKIIFTQSARGGLYFLFKALSQKRVFIPSYTCWVVVEAALLAQKEVEFIDIRLTDYNLDTEILRKKIKPDSIILATHQFGIPCDIEEILKIAEENQCYVIEDNAAAFGSKYKEKRTGSFAGASVISFEFTKTLTCGRGGAILFNDEQLYDKAQEIYTKKNNANSSVFTLKYLLFLFFNKLLTQKTIYKLINLVFIKTKGLTSACPDYKAQPDVLYSNKLNPGFKNLTYRNLQRIENTISKRKDISSHYSRSLAEAGSVEIPVYDSFKSPVFMRYPIRLKKMSKENFYNSMNKQGVDLAFTFPYSCDPDKENSPKSYAAAATVLNLPIYSRLNNSDIDKIIGVVKNTK